MGMYNEIGFINYLDIEAAGGLVPRGLAAEKSVRPAAVLPGEALTYTLSYTHGGADLTLVVSDTVPRVTPIDVVTGPGTVVVAGQDVTWSVLVQDGDVVVLTVRATAAVTPGLVINTAVFSGALRLVDRAAVLISSDRAFLPLVLRRNSARDSP